MKATIITIVILTAQLFAVNSFSQKNAEVKSRIKIDKTFQVSGKSRTVKMNKGETYQLSLELKKDKAYYISVSGNKSLSDIQYKLISEDEHQETLFDNSAYEFNSNTMISVKENSKVRLEIITQPSDFYHSSTQKKDVELLIASKNMKNAVMEDLPNMIVLASND